MVIMTAMALIISLALWNLFMSTASIQSEQALTASTLARESARVSVVALSSVKVNNAAYRFAFQVTTLDYQPVTIYLMVLYSVTTSPRPASFTLYEVENAPADITSASTLTLIPNTTARTEIAEADYVMIRPVNSNEYAPLSIYYTSSVTMYRLLLNGVPKCIVVEVPTSLVNNQAQLTVLIKISNRYYQITALPLS